MTRPSWRTAGTRSSLSDLAHDPRVLPHGLGTVLTRLAAEPAVHRHAEVRYVPRRRRDPAAQPRGPVDRKNDAEEHPRVAGLKVSQRPEEAAVLAAQVPRSREVQPVHGAP